MTWRSDAIPVLLAMLSHSVAGFFLYASTQVARAACALGGLFARVGVAGDIQHKNLVQPQGRHLGFRFSVLGHTGSRGGQSPRFVCTLLPTHQHPPHSGISPVVFPGQMLRPLYDVMPSGKFFLSPRCDFCVQVVELFVIQPRQRMRESSSSLGVRITPLFFRKRPCDGLSWLSTVCRAPCWPLAA